MFFLKRDVAGSFCHHDCRSCSRHRPDSSLGKATGASSQCLRQLDAVKIAASLLAGVGVDRGIDCGGDDPWDRRTSFHLRNIVNSGNSVRRPLGTPRVLDDRESVGAIKEGREYEKSSLPGIVPTEITPLGAKSNFRTSIRRVRNRQNRTIVPGARDRDHNPTSVRRYREAVEDTFLDNPAALAAVCLHAIEIVRSSLDGAER